MTNKPRIQNIVFDWSGTLSSDMMPVYETVMKVFAHFGVGRISFDEFRDTYTLPYTIHARMFGIAASREELDRVFAEHFRNAGFPEPIPGAEKVLQQLKSSGKRMIVLSSHRQHFLAEEAARFFKGNHYVYFEKIFGDVHNKVAEIGNVLRQMNFAAAETLIVGDTGHDIAAGHEAGIFTAGVLSGYKSRKHLEEAKPHFIVNDVRELLKLGIF